MATDPYHTFVADLKTSLESARQLSRKYQTLQSKRREASTSSTSHQNHTPNYGSGRIDSYTDTLSPPGIESQLQDTYTELQDQLETLENDINDVQESVEMLEKRGPELFGVDSTELGRRKRFVQSCTDEVRVSDNKRSS